MVHDFVLKSDYFTSSDGVRIHFLQTTKARSDSCLLFLHGAGGDATAWRKVQATCFEQGYSSVAIDLRGHGLSDDPIDAGAYAFEKLAQDVDELINKLGLRQVVLVGHCFGGMASIVLAARKPCYLRGLILVDTSDSPSVFGFPLSASNVLASIARKLAICFGPGIKQVRPTYDIFIGTKDINFKRLLSDVKYTSLRSYLFCYSDLLAFDGRHLLEKINTSTLVLCGELDVIFPPKNSYRLAKSIKGAKLVIIPNTNHIIVISDPKTLSENILSFVKNL